VSNRGANTVTFHSTDKAGNVEPIKSVSFTIEDSTTTLLMSSQNPSVTGSTVEFTATVKSSIGAATGTVTFKNGTTTLGTGTLSSGVATFSTSTLSIGLHSITAVYSGATNVLASTSPVLAQNVLAKTSTSVTASANPTVFGQPVTFTATVTSPTSGTISGKVMFNDGASTIGSGTINSGKASLITSGLLVGGHSITVTYTGSMQYATSTSSTLSHTVNVASSKTTLSSSANPSVIGQLVTFTSTVTTVAPSTGTPGGSVRFMNGTTELGVATLTGGKATFKFDALPIGTNSITAVYGGSTDFSSSTSSAVVQKVNPAGTITDLTASPNPATVGATVTLRVVISAASPGLGIPTGSVTINDGSTALATIALGAGGSATFSTTKLAKGAHSITAVYRGSADFLSSTSAVLTETIN
jgi:predicted secreted protein